MGRLRLGGFVLATAISSLWSLSGCGGHSSPGINPYPARVNLTPGTSTSVQLGTIFTFTASAQTSSGSVSSVTFTFASSDTSILNLAPNGVACAGHWDAAYTTCTPGNIGVAQVTASALGATSPPTYVFVHPPIDNIKVTGVLLDSLPIQEPCLSQGQSMTVEAHAYSQGSDITSSVGPFTWSANNANVVKLTPLVNLTYTFPTNQATATATIPGITQIYATASGVSSNTFYQPQYQKMISGSAQTSPLLDFFETCPIQNITLELGPAGSQQTGQTTFVAAKGAPQTATAVLTDVMGNNSLTNPNAAVVLSKIPLTWTASQPAVVAAASGCQLSCSLSTPSPGAGSVTASCAPPNCNIGFPQVPLALSTASSLAVCAQFFQIPSCAPFIPVPVYATTAVSGLVTGSPSTTTVLATSNGCQDPQAAPPLDCSTSIYAVGTSKSVAGLPTFLPDSPNSLRFDLAGDKAFMGSEIAAVAIIPANLGTSTGAFNSVGSVTGQVLAVSNNGSLAVFSDTQLVPNQVFIVNTTTAAAAVTALNITAASAAAFSPDGSKTLIFGFDSNGNPNLYIYSTIQSLQTIPLAANTIAKSIAFSPNAAFAYLLEAPATGATPAPSLNAYSLCNNQIAGSITLPSTPAAMHVLPGPQLPGRDSAGNPIPDGTQVLLLDTSGFDVVTSSITAPALGTLQQPGVLCPQTLNFITGDAAHPNQPQRIELGQGTIQPLDFFTSADASLLYVLAADRSSVLVHDSATGATNGIELVGNATPLSGSMTSDAGTIVIAGSDGMLHSVSTALGGTDLVPPLQFPNLPNYLNSFCTFTPASGPCTLNLVAVKP